MPICTGRRGVGSPTAARAVCPPPPTSHWSMDGTCFILFESDAAFCQGFILRPCSFAICVVRPHPLLRRQSPTIPRAPAPAPAAPCAPTRIHQLVCGDRRRCVILLLGVWRESWGQYPPAPPPAYPPEPPPPRAAEGLGIASFAVLFGLRVF